jgi:hypothetical protein
MNRTTKKKQSTMDINIELDAMITDDACHVSRGGLDGILKAL